MIKANKHYIEQERTVICHNFPIIKIEIDKYCPNGALENTPKNYSESVD